MRYEKPHLPYDKQLTRLAERGMRHSDSQRAIESLKSIGYYRFSAYTYPFREFAPQDEGGRPVGPRPDQFQDGSTFEEARALHDFDQTLRRCLAAGLEEVEVGLRTQIAYILGRTDPFGHLETVSLDPAACTTVLDPHTGETAFDRFLASYERQQHEAKGEDYVKHFHTKYDGKMPIWVASEFMSFGLMVRLYNLLGKREAEAVTRLVEIRDRKLVHKYLKALSVLRNDCAHHCRVWNRSTIYPPARPPAKLTHERLHHVRDADSSRLYPLAALTAHFAIQLNPATNWPRKFKETMRKFPAPLGMSPEKQMGFPAGWSSQPIWAYEPKSR